MYLIMKTAAGAEYRVRDFNFSPLLGLAIITEDHISNIEINLDSITEMELYSTCNMSSRIAFDDLFKKITGYNIDQFKDKGERYTASGYQVWTYKDFEFKFARADAHVKLIYKRS